MGKRCSLSWKWSALSWENFTCSIYIIDSGAFGEGVFGIPPKPQYIYFFTFVSRMHTKLDNIRKITRTTNKTNCTNENPEKKLLNFINASIFVVRFKCQFYLTFNIECWMHFFTVSMKACSCVKLLMNFRVCNFCSKLSILAPIVFVT
jgi:hypothetical protein